MKKLNLLLLGAFISSTLFFAGCSSDDDPAPSGPSVNPGNSNSVSTALGNSNTNWTPVDGSLPTATGEIKTWSPAADDGVVLSGSRGSEVIITIFVEKFRQMTGASIQVEGANEHFSIADSDLPVGPGDDVNSTFDVVVSISNNIQNGVFNVVISLDSGGVIVGEHHTISIEVAPAGSDVVAISEDISGDVTWTADNIYRLDRRIAVLDGATLNIEAGTIIKGGPGSGANATSLLVAQGGKLNAMGTADNPIIFTSIADELSIADMISGNYESPNLDPNLQGLWGGILILGKAPISVKSNADFEQIEGIPASDPNGQYGGTDPADNSGTIKYISIRHGGSNIGEGNEINGLTLGGVGTGTVIEYVEVVGNQDDGIECFGGTVNITNALVWNNGDDQYDMDQAYAGTIDNFIGIGGPNTDHMMELDGPEGNKTGTYTLQNGSLKLWNSGGKNGGEYADLRSNSLCILNSIYMFNGSESSDFELDDDGSSTNYSNGDTKFSMHEINVSHLTAGNMTIDDIYNDKSNLGDAFTNIPPDAAIVTTPTVGADKSKFAGWTWADQAGELADF